MPQCAGIKRDGGRCTVIVTREQTYCYQHDPTRAAERKRNAARGGKAKASGEITRVKTSLQDLAGRVLEGSLERADAAVIGQLWNVYLSAIRTELKAREAEELVREVEEIREMLERRGQRGWG